MYTMQVPGGQGRVRSPENGVRQDCEPPYKYWKKNVGPLQKLLTVKPPLQHHYLSLYHKFPQKCEGSGVCSIYPFNISRGYNNT